MVFLHYLLYKEEEKKDYEQKIEKENSQLETVK